jgi:amidase
MNGTSLAFTPALEQAELVRTRQVSPLELVDLYLARIEELNPELNAYITVAAEFARDAALAAERAVGAGDELPPFHGVPISIKDLNDTAGIVSTHGTAEWRDRVPERDDEVVARIKRAGFVILGKTVVPEFGPLNVSEPPGYPPGRNPWDPARSCGGSSGGAAAAIAAGLCPISHGSDGGGSIRNPAAWCGVFGIKPSRGRVSAAPAPQQLFAINGPLARTVADAAALLDAMAGPATGDAWWAPPPARPFLAEAGADPGRLRIAFHRHPGVECDATAPACRQVVDDTAALLEALGHTVFEREPPVFGPDLLALTAIVFAASHASLAGVRPPLETQDPWMKTLTELGQTVAATDYIGALATIQGRCREAVAFFDDVDVLLCPTVAEPPPLVGAMRDAGIEQMPRFFAMTPFTALWNTTGQPAVSLPLAMDDDGLPVGAQLVGRPADEATLIRLSSQLEQARPWRDRRPPVS